MTASTVYDVTVSGGDLADLNGTVTLGFASGQDIEDTAGTALSATAPTGTNEASYAVDNSAPAVTSIARQDPATSPTKADSLTWRVTFDEHVANVDAADFAVSGTAATVTAVDEVTASTVYDVTVSGGDLADLNGTVTLGFASGQDIEDTAGTALANLTPTGTNENTYAVDNTAPAVTSIARQDPATSPTKADSLTWRVTFSEAVANVDAADFAVSGTAATVTAVDEVTTSTVYDVTVSGGDLADLNGTVTLGFASGQDIQDTSSNALANLTPTGTNEASYAVDNSAPTVDSAGVDGTSLVVTFSEDLAQADNLANSAFTVEKTPTGGSAETVSLAGSPAIDGKTVTLTLGAAVTPTDTVTVSYAPPGSGTDNTLKDLAGNAVTSFSDQAMTNNAWDRRHHGAGGDVDRAPGSGDVADEGGQPDLAGDV